MLEPYQKQYDLIMLDCPPTINLLAENIFNAADYLLVPLIPTTLSLRTHGQLLAFLEESAYTTDKVYTFFFNGRLAQKDASGNGGFRKAPV